MQLLAVSDAVWLGLLQFLTLALGYWIKLRQDSSDRQRAVMRGELKEVHGLVDGLAQKREDVATNKGITNTTEATTQGATNTAGAVAQGKLDTAEAVAQGIVNSAQAFQEGVKSETNKSS